jgi:hypothetical protein
MEGTEGPSRPNQGKAQPQPQHREQPSLSSSSYQLIWARMNEYKRLVESHVFLDSNLKSGCDEIITAVRSALQHRFFRLFPYAQYDLAWAGLFEMRNWLCEALPLRVVASDIAEEIREDLGYLDDTDAAKQDAVKTLPDIVDKMTAAIEAGQDGNDHRSPEQQMWRTRLRAISQLTSLTRRAHWLKVNLTRPGWRSWDGC